MRIIPTNNPSISYAHCDDYTGYFEDGYNNLKKWTTKEMQQEVVGVINQLCEKEV